MNPTEFTTAAIAWLGAIGTVAAVAIPIYFKIKAQIRDNQSRIDEHDKLQNVDTSTANTQPQPKP